MVFDALNRIALEKASTVAYSEINYTDEKPGGAQGAAERIIQAYLAALPCEIRLIEPEFTQEQLRENLIDVYRTVSVTEHPASERIDKIMELVWPLMKQEIGAPLSIQFSALWEYYKASEAYRNIQTALDHDQSIKPGQYEDTCNRYVMARAAISEIEGQEGK